MRSVRTRPDADLTAALTAARLAVLDLMLFAGVGAEVARAATREKEREQPEPQVPAPASARKSRLERLVRRLRRPIR